MHSIIKKQFQDTMFDDNSIAFIIITEIERGIFMF